MNHADEYNLISEPLKLILDQYARTGYFGGGHFLTAVLENKLVQAHGRADSVNVLALPQICKYLYNQMPADCWGSPGKVARWESVGGIQGLDRAGGDWEKAAQLQASDPINPWSK